MFVPLNSHMKSTDLAGTFDLSNMLNPLPVTVSLSVTLSDYRV